MAAGRDGGRRGGQGRQHRPRSGRDDGTATAGHRRGLRRRRRRGRVRSGGARYTARPLDRIPGTVFVAGDATYPSGTMASYTSCYGPTWGRHLWRTFAVPGNHDYQSDGGAAFYQDSGAAAGPPGLGYDSHTLGAWHVVMLNSMIPGQGRGRRNMNGSGKTSGPREQRAPSRSGTTRSSVRARPATTRSWVTSGTSCSRDGVDVVVNGDDHLTSASRSRMPTAGPTLGASGSSSWAPGATRSTIEAHRRQTVRCSRTRRLAS